MIAKGKMLALGMLLIALAAFGAPYTLTAQDKVLNVYGPGGPLGPMKECAEMFSKTHGVEARVVAGPTPQWIDKAKQDADLIFGGAEYMLTEFIQKYPGLVEEKTRTSLYIRAAGILVRKGNPKKITSLSDLAKDGIKLIDVNGAGQVGLWEDMAGAHGLIPGIRKNIALSVTTSADAIGKWETMPELDAWITYESWHYRLKDLTDLARLPEKQKLYRGTPIAVTTISKNKELAKQFIDFLKTEQCHKVFQKWGWK